MRTTALIFAAALAAGVVNSVSGGGTLITFPILVWTGMEPVIANATNTVALCPGILAALIGRWRELRDEARIWPLLIPCILGGLIGAVILIHTPSQIFQAVAPGLMLFASLILGAHELLYRNAERVSIKSRDSSTQRRIAIGAALFLIAIYGGYFGAGTGILILALLPLAGINDIHRMIAIRVFCSMCMNASAAVYFSVFSKIDWRVAGAMAAAQIAGNWIGTSTSRKIDAMLLRRSIVGFGVAMASWLVRSA